MSETSTTNPNQQERRFSPLAIIGIAAVAVAGALIALRGCGEAEETAPKSESPVTTTTTTVPEFKPPYWEKYGWDIPEDVYAADRNIEDNHQEGLKIAAGRCVVKLSEGHNGTELAEYWEILRNPIVTEGSANGYQFTTFSGYQEVQHEDYDEEVVLTPYTSVIDGEMLWGSVGIVPNQTAVIDIESPVRASDEYFTNPDYDALYLFSRSSTNRYYRNQALEEGVIPAEVIVIPRSQEWRVPEYCAVPAFTFKEPPASKA